MSALLTDPAAPGRRPRRRAATRLPRPRVPLVTLLAALVLAAVAVCFLAPGLVETHPPARADVTARLQSPSSDHLAGTDSLGRDVFSRVVAGTRSAVGGPLVIAFGAIAVATLLGMLMGYRRGWLDVVLSRAVDVLWALPGLLIVIVVVGVIGGGYWAAVAVLIVLFVPEPLRLVRAATIEQTVKPYIEATRMLDLGTLRVLGRHLLPNLYPMLAANFFLSFTYGITALASLSFLGLGDGPGSTNWGRLLAENRADVFANPWGAIAPAVAIIATAVAVNLVGGAVCERLADRGRAR